MDKNLYIISGCNGAGKTTASYTVLPEVLECKEFVNADEIAKGLSPFNPESMAIEAGRLMLQRIDDLLSQNVTFSIETTLSTKSYLNLVRRAQQQGYRVSILFFWLHFLLDSKTKILPLGLQSAHQFFYSLSLNLQLYFFVIACLLHVIF